MAKRKRLTPANPTYLSEEGAVSAGHPGLSPRAPIADVAAEAASQAALEDVVGTLTRAREEGRMVLSLSLDRIDQGYLVRDRVAVEDGEMAALKASLMDRGQQMPVDVVALGDGRYGLISGWRRCQALTTLFKETGDPRFGEVLALQRQPAELSDSYLAMVEENEIRANLSFFERARIAAKAVDQGVFETEKAALLDLFRAASRAKRSKIRSFLILVRELDGALRFPQAIGERLGLQLSKRLDQDAGFAKALRKALKAADVDTAEAEQEVLISTLNRTLESDTGARSTAPAHPWEAQDIRPDLRLRRHQGDGRIELRGAALTDDLVKRLQAWLKDQA